jgi:hypothetical protein
MKIGFSLLALFFAFFIAAQLAAPPRHPSEAAMADRIQTKLLNPILGNGQSTAFVLSRAHEDLKIFVLLDEGTPPEKIKEVNSALLAVYGPELKPGDVRFQTASFSAAK